VDAPVPLIVASLLAAAAIVLRAPRARAWAMLGALVLAPVILVAHIADTPQLRPLRDSPSLAVAAGALGLIVVGLLAFLFHRRPRALPVAAVAALPFRVPIASGGSTANLLVPLYLVVAAGTVAHVVPRLRGEIPADDRPPGAMEWALGAYLALYGVQAAYSIDFGRALENVVFFYVPFALLFVLVRRVTWTPGLVRVCVGVLAALAIALAGVGFVEYATRHIFLNPKVIASNQLGSYFRVNSLFFDPNIFGRFLVIVMLLLSAWLLWSTRARHVLAGAAILAVLWGGLVLTFSQSSFVSLLVGLAVLGGLRWSMRWATAALAAAVVIAVAVAAIAPGAVRIDLNSSKSADQTTSGRYDLITGGAQLFADRPVEGWGSGAFPREYRRKEKVSAERATSASHTIPLTVAAEQGLIGLAAYVALLVLAFVRLFRGARHSAARAAVVAAFTALVAHTMMYAAFLEDPLSWTLLGVGTALAAQAAVGRRTRRAPAAGERATAPV
jgi:O-antigen ligase